MIHEGLGEPDYGRQLALGQLALVKITDPNEIPDFSAAWADLSGLHEAIARSLDYLAKPSSARCFPYGDIPRDKAVASLRAFDALIAQRVPASQINQVIRQQFDVYTSVGWDGRGTVLFTGYYTPILEASPVQTERFRYPLYRAPAGILKDEEGNVQGVKMADGSVQKMADRAGLESSGQLKGLELVWLADKFEVYIAQVQGSAKLRMPDGSLKTVGYTANNGYEYKSVGEAMVKDGKVAEKDLSLQWMIRYFRAHGDELDRYVKANPRFVFFAESDGPPRGCLNEPVTTWRTIATDKSIFPRACLAMVRTRRPQMQGASVQMTAFNNFACDQDAGGGIRAPGRCDIYMGEGDSAADLAGRTKEEGRLYYLFLK
jgi:membrane-bound lytic murein transglycosylase A